MSHSQPRPRRRGSTLSTAAIAALSLVACGDGGGGDDGADSGPGGDSDADVTSADADVTAAPNSWKTRVGGDLTDGTGQLLAVPGGVVVAGATLSHAFSEDYLDGWLFRIDDGETPSLAWESHIGRDLWNDRVSALALGTGGSAFVVGATQISPPGIGDRYHGLVVKFDVATGEVTWKRQHAASDEDAHRAVVALADGGAIVGGYLAPAKSDLLLYRINASGEKVWAKTASLPEFEMVEQLIPASDGVIVVAHSDSFDDGDRDLWLIKLDLDGALQWQKTIGGAAPEWPLAAAAADNGDIVIAGWTGSAVEGDEQIWVVRVDSGGDVLWSRALGTAEHDEAKGVAVAPNGDIVIAGLTGSFVTDSEDAVILRLTGDGAGIVWQKVITGAGNGRATAMTMAGEAIVVAMSEDGAQDGDRDASVIQLLPDGTVEGGCSALADGSMTNAELAVVEAVPEVSLGDLFMTEQDSTLEVAAVTGSAASGQCPP